MNDPVFGRLCGTFLSGYLMLTAFFHLASPFTRQAKAAAAHTRRLWPVAIIALGGVLYYGELWNGSTVPTVGGGRPTLASQPVVIQFLIRQAAVIACFLVLVSASGVNRKR